jgi:hypothetical protein
MSELAKDLRTLGTHTHTNTHTHTHTHTHADVRKCQYTHANMLIYIHAIGMTELAKDLRTRGNTITVTPL